MTDQAARPAPGDRAVPAQRVVLAGLAMLSVLAAVIHFAVAGSHFQEYWLFGVFMLGVAWLQLGWAAAALFRPTRLLVSSGAVLNAAVIVVYTLTRTVGDIVGPDPGDVEPAGFGDLLCTVAEAAIVAGCLWLLVTRVSRVVRRDQASLAAAAGAGVLAALLSVALVDGGPEMVMTAGPGPAASAAGSGAAAAGMAGMTSPGSSGRTGTMAPVHLATSSPAGFITDPDPGMQMEPGMKMASPVACTASATAAQQRAAVQLVNASWRGAQQYRSLAAARAAGYRPITPSGLPVVHYLNPAFYRDTLLGGPVLDTSQPQSLVYANTPKGAVLVAAMYITTPRGATPQPGGCLTQWHVHTNLCLRAGLGVVGVTGAGHPACPAGSRNRVTPAMMHVWFVPIPGGPTAVDAPDAQVVRAAEQVAAPHNGTA
jgi:hypothetical protein